MAAASITYTVSADSKPISLGSYLCGRERALASQISLNISTPQSDQTPSKNVPKICIAVRQDGARADVGR
jgi:hypothetical protein